jgi:uncharacterized protein YqhQ
MRVYMKVKKNKKPEDKISAFAVLVLIAFSFKFGFGVLALLPLVFTIQYCLRKAYAKKQETKKQTVNYVEMWADKMKY